MGLGHLRSEAAPLQHVQHLAQISMASTVAAFESPCVIGGGTEPLAWLSPEPDAESASGIEARRRIPYTLYLAKCCWPIAPAPAPPLRIGNTGGPLGCGGHRDSVVAPCGCNGPNHDQRGAGAGECSDGGGGGQVHGAGLRQPRGAHRSTAARCQPLHDGASTGGRRAGGHLHGGPHRCSRPHQRAEQEARPAAGSPGFAPTQSTSPALLRPASPSQRRWHHKQENARVLGARHSGQLYSCSLVTTPAILARKYRPRRSAPLSASDQPHSASDPAPVRPAGSRRLRGRAAQRSCCTSQCEV